MPVAIIMEFDGTTLEQYDGINRKMGLVPGGFIGRDHAEDRITAATCTAAMSGSLACC